MCFSFEEVGTDEETKELIEEGKEKLEDGVKEKVEEKVNGLKCVVKAKAIWGFGRWFVTQIAILFALLQKPERPTAFDTFKNMLEGRWLLKYKKPARQPQQPHGGLSRTSYPTVC